MKSSWPSRAAVHFRTRSACVSAYSRRSNIIPHCPAPAIGSPWYRLWTDDHEVFHSRRSGGGGAWAQISMFALIERVGSKEAVVIVHMRSGHSCRSGAALSRARVVVVSWCRSDGVRSARSAQMFALWIKQRERERKNKLTSCLYGEERPPPPPS